MGNSSLQRQRIEVTKELAARVIELEFNGGRDSVQDNEKPSGTDNGDVGLYNTVNGLSATIHLKMIKLVNCRLYLFYHVKNN